MFPSTKDKKIIDQLIELGCKNENARIIDVGCGMDDSLGVWIAQNFNTSNFTLIDKNVSGYFQERGVQKIDVLDYVKDNANEYDIVISKNVIHMSENLKECKMLFEACFGLLKIGGIMYLSVLNEEYEIEGHMGGKKINLTDKQLLDVIGTKEIYFFDRIKGNTEFFIRR